MSRTQTSMLSASRPPRNSRRGSRRSGQNLGSDDPFSAFDEISPKRGRRRRRRPDSDDTLDDDVDDGFLSRYRQQNPSDKASLDAEEEDRRPIPRMDRQTAASAFDAVDKLFGSKREADGGAKNTDPESQGGHAAWLADVKARASTRVDAGEGKDLDVSVVEDEKEGDGPGDGPGEEDAFSEADVEGEGEGNSSTTAPRMSGFKEHGGKSSAQTKSSIKSFENFMKVARKGPNSRGGIRKRFKVSERRRAREEVSETVRDERTVMSQLLGITDKSRTSNEKDDDYEPVDDIMEKTITVGGSRVRDEHRNGRRRQHYLAVRRIGGRTRTVSRPPEDWLPMTEEDVEEVQTDSRSLGGKKSLGRHVNVVSDCKTCIGSGLETCRVCRGEGWVKPLKEGVETNALLEELWSRPNLVVDSHGEAQCVFCRGIGKEFCSTCEGSGSALNKGFSVVEFNKVFDMFPNVEGDSVVVEEDDEFEEDDVEDQEDLDFQLYRGSADDFELGRDGAALERGIGDVEDGEDVEDEFRVEDESAELLAALEVMHMADMEERGTEYMDGRKGRAPSVDRDEEDEDDDEGDVEEEDDDFEMVMEDESGLNEDIQVEVDVDEYEDDDGEEEGVIIDATLNGEEEEDVEGIDDIDEEDSEYEARD